LPRLDIPFDFVCRSSIAVPVNAAPGGGRLSTSLHGVRTGRGAAIIIIVDDPIKADDALSEPVRTAAKTWLFKFLMCD
jgi:hypothetical protein